MRRARTRTTGPLISPGFAGPRPQKAREFRSEDEFVQWLRGRTGGLRRGVGVGDDAAVLAWRRGWRLLLTADLSIEGVHFDTCLHPPESVGHRALARSLSDIAAMGGAPRVALVSLALSSRMTRRWVERFYAGLLALARRFRVEIAGGDTARTPGQSLVDVVVAGEALARNILLRSGAQAGDRLYVAGELGAAALGLHLLRAGAGRNSRALRPHLYPEPQCKIGRYLAARRLASAAMDLSDGLSTDLARLCAASDVGARVRTDQLPLARFLPTRNSHGPSPLSLALHGGEDYKLLFSVPASKASLLPAAIGGVRLHEIGEVTASRAIILISADGVERPLAPGGYDHFEKRYSVKEEAALRSHLAR